MAIYFNVENDSDKFDEMLTYSGGKAKVPVIVEGDKVTVGFVGDASVQRSISLRSWLNGEKTLSVRDNYR